MKFIFIVQGEGRGHLTQAISMSQILRQHGHEVSHVLLGKTEGRVIPSYFVEKIGTDVTLFDSPALVLDGGNRRIKIGATLWRNILHASRYFKNLRLINQIVEKHKPDAVINFYELMAGLYFARYRPNTVHICVAHQYLIQHPVFRFPEGHVVDKWLLLINNKMTKLRVNRILALSFQPEADLPKKKIFVAPPLLRSQIMEMQPTVGDYILGYMVYPGYAENVKAWHAKNSDIKAMFFWNRTDVPDELVINENLKFCRLNDEKFLHLMAGCKAYMSSAGFESVCEAGYFGKPTMVVPTEGHYEQYCNGEDSVRTGIAARSYDYDLGALLKHIDEVKARENVFKPWIESAPARFIELIESAVANKK
jgi:uncharacterized protein (TIGR00661 family)